MPTHKKKYKSISVITRPKLNLMEVWVIYEEKSGGEKFDSHGHIWDVYLVDEHVVLISPFTHKPAHVFGEMESFRHFLRDLSNNLEFKTADDKPWNKIEYA